MDILVNNAGIATASSAFTIPHRKPGILGLTRSYASLLVKEGYCQRHRPALVETDVLASFPGLTPDRLPVGFFGSVGINPNGGFYFN